MLSKTTQAVTAAVGIALAMTATACDPHTADKNAAVSEESESHPSAMAQKYRRNPDPRQRYDITMTIADAPGPFGSVQGFAQYEAPDCWYTLDRIAGVPAIPNVTLPVSYTKIDDTTYVGTVYLDAMQDEDYFGRGICRWVLTSARVSLEATGSKTETSFSARLSPDQVQAQASEAAYYMKQFYPQDEKMEGFSESGQTDRSQFAPYVTDDELFTITLVAKEVQA